MCSLYVCVFSLSSCSFVLCVFSLSSFCVVLSSLLFPCVYCSPVCVCYVSALCLGLCLLGVPSVFCVYSTVCLCVTPSLCVFSCVCLLYVSYICVACICYWFVCLYCVSAYCVCVSVYLMCACVTALVCIVSVYLLSVVPLVCSLCMCVVCVLCVFFILCVSVYLFPCMYVYVSTVFYVYCICYVYVCFSVVCLCCWLPCWCGVYHGGVMGACFLGLVVLVFWGFGVCGIFLFFYSRFPLGGRLLLGFCYRTFFCGFPWGLCHARNFFKDITHSCYCCVISVMGLYMCLLAHLYRTPHCSDIAPVYTCARVCLCLCSYLLASMSPPCFILCCPGIVSALHLVLCLLVLVVCRVLHSVLGAIV